MSRGRGGAQGALDLGTGGAPPPALPEGVRHLPGRLDGTAQRALVDEVLGLVGQAGWLEPVMPRSGRPLSVAMCNLGALGWITDRRGYRYEPVHPLTCRPWPPIPRLLLDLWEELAGYPHPPECCLVNLYREGARMGMHQDRDEAELAAPVLSVSLGDEAVFRVGGRERREAGVRLPLLSGDVLLMGGPARLLFHGVDRIMPGTSPLVPGGGRLNLTLRRVTQPDDGPRTDSG
ncbi:alpha-ketoglutarate-dependent dioxygenase AlkB [Geminicoccaceae bacterium 1502E]|nr:alpha-ketoglutarate-dependent dioxygenase AlkB [Geminicoccaceae bacterium 1502E]